MRSPGFGPGFLPWQGNVLDQVAPVSARLLPFSSENGLDYDRTNEQLIVNTLITLKTKGVAPNYCPLAESSIEKTDDKLKQLRKNADLRQPEDVKTFIANHPVKNSSKEELVKAYNYLCLANGIQWTKPKYKWIEETVQIPTAESITKIVSSCKRRYRIIYTLMAEIGMSPAELHYTKRRDIDLEKGIINITGRKGHESAPYKLKPSTLEMLREYLAIWKDELPFPNSKALTHTWNRAKHRVADQLKQPEILSIELRHLRNYSGAQYYNSLPVRDPIAVMRHLRHKKIDRTMRYIKAMILDLTDDQWVSLVTKSTYEECKAIDKGYQLVRSINETTAIYKKRKGT